MKKIGIIGGSGFTDFDDLQVLEQLRCTTPWGDPSSALLRGVVKPHNVVSTVAKSDVTKPVVTQQVEIIFLARHGSGHHGEKHLIPPHRVNYRANIAAMKQQGVTEIYAINIVGSINVDIRPGDLVIPDQIVDYTWGREHTYFDDFLQGLDKQPDRYRPLQHIDFTSPYDSALRNNLLRQAETIELMVHAGGTYGATQGPRLETAAEIERMRRDGCDLVGMTGMPEAALARELGIPYASLALVVNMAAGLVGADATMETIQKIMDQRFVSIRKLLIALAVI